MDQTQRQQLDPKRTKAAMASRWNSGRRTTGADIVKRYRITVRRAGRDWNGLWEIEGDNLHVTSAYASRKNFEEK